MKNVDELYEKYYNAYKSHYDNDHELNEAKKKKFDYKQVKPGDRTDEETKDSKLTHYQNGRALKMILMKRKKLINDIRDDTNNVKPGSGDKKFLMIWKY